MPTPESKVKLQVKKLLKEFHCYQFWPVQTGYGAATLDCIGCFGGRFFSIETKAPGKKPTPRQELTMADINAARGAVFVIGEKIVALGNGEFTYSGMEELRAWLLLGP